MCLLTDSVTFLAQIWNAIRADCSHIGMFLYSLNIWFIWDILKWFLRFLSILGEFRNSTIYDDFIVILMQFGNVILRKYIIMFACNKMLSIYFLESLSIFH